jgi:hypothetical protein
VTPPKWISRYEKDFAEFRKPFPRLVVSITFRTHLSKSKLKRKLKAQGNFSILNCRFLTDDSRFLQMQREKSKSDKNTTFNNLSTPCQNLQSASLELQKRNRKNVYPSILSN